MRRFLRRHSGGYVYPSPAPLPMKAFQCRDKDEAGSCLSLTGCELEWPHNELLLYQERSALPSGDLPAIIELEADGLPSAPRPCPDSSDRFYGDLHHCHPCLDEAGANELALAATAGLNSGCRFLKRVKASKRTRQQI